MRAALDRLLVVLLLASGLVAAYFGHQHLWRLWVRTAGGLAPNLRLLAPLGLFVACAAALALLHADAVARALTPRRALRGAQGTLAVVLAVAVAVLVNLVAARRFERIDVTSTRSHTLGADTRDALAGIGRPVTAIACFAPEDPWSPAVRSLLDAYAAEAGNRFAATTLNPWQQGSRLAAVLEQLRIPPGDLVEPRALILSREDGEGRPPRSRIVGLDELVGLEVAPGVAGSASGGAVGRTAADGAASPARAPRLVFRGEAALTGALLDLARTPQPLVCVLAGRSERALAGASAPPPHSRLIGALRARGLRVEPLGSPGEPGRSAIPLGCDVLITVAPRARLDVGELGALHEWLVQGGRLLVFAEPAPAAARTGPDWLAREEALSRLLAGVGLGLSGEVVDAGFDVALGDPAEGGLHPLLEGPARRGAPIRFHGAELLSARRPAGDARVEAILAARRDGGPEVPLIALGRRRYGDATREARVVLVGDADLAADPIVEPAARTGNLDVLVGAVRWLGDLDVTVDAEARPPVITDLALDADDERRIWLLCLLEAPGACALVALFVHLVRRR